MSHLHALPLTKIKIDRSFVTDLHKNPASYKIVKSLLALSRYMGLDCIVEGVDEGTNGRTQNVGRKTVQRYFYSRPIQASDIDDFLGKSVGACDGATTKRRWHGGRQKM